MTWVGANWPYIVQLALEHLALAAPPILLSFVIAVPIGRLAFRYPRFGKPLLTLFALGYAIPALPLLVVIPILFGTPLRSSAPMIIALTIYGVALLVRSAEDGFAAVDPHVRDAAIATGNSPSSVFWRVDLPLAFPVILAGVRVVAVSTIALVTIGALIGVRSLGTLLTDGFQRGIIAEVLAGIGATVLVALLVDVALLLTGRILTPWQYQQRSAAAGQVSTQ